MSNAEDQCEINVVLENRDGQAYAPDSGDLEGILSVLVLTARARDALIELLRIGYPEKIPFDRIALVITAKCPNPNCDEHLPHVVKHVVFDRPITEDALLRMSETVGNDVSLLLSSNDTVLQLRFTGDAPVPG